MPDTWTVTGTKNDGARLWVGLENEDGRTLRVFLTAGELAALGRKGEALFDGKPQKKENP